ncbi:MAG TPA: hypothetical protein PKX30_00960 [Candidatus Pacearchaeota archaeon]|nr:hypothetical protein [Candidatus Pacearchaeota archaeon]
MNLNIFKKIDLFWIAIISGFFSLDGPLSYFFSYDNFFSFFISPFWRWVLSLIYFISALLILLDKNYSKKGLIRKIIVIFPIYGLMTLFSVLALFLGFIFRFKKEEYGVLITAFFLKILIFSNLSLLAANVYLTNPISPLLDFLGYFYIIIILIIIDFIFLNINIPTSANGKKQTLKVFFYVLFSNIVLYCLSTLILFLYVAFSGGGSW